MMISQKILTPGEEVTKVTEEHSMEATRFLEESEEKIIAEFMEIVGLGDKYREVTTNKRGKFRDYAIALLMEELHKRGYEIGEYHEPLTSMLGINKGMKWRMILLHDGKEVAYSNIEIKTDWLWRK